MYLIFLYQRRAAHDLVTQYRILGPGCGLVHRMAAKNGIAPADTLMSTIE